MLLVVHHLHQEGLPRGHVKRIDQALEGAEPDDFLNVDMPGESQNSQRQRLKHCEGLRDHQDLAAIQAVNPDPGKRGKQECRDLS